MSFRMDAVLPLDMVRLATVVARLRRRALPDHDGEMKNWNGYWLAGPPMDLWQRLNENE